MTDNRDEIAAALAAAHVPENAIADAVAIFQANARHESDGWYVGSLMKGTLPRAVAKFLETRPHFIGTPKPPGDEDKPSSIFDDPRYPRNHRGEPLPLDSLTQDQLFELSGPDPNQKDPALWQVQDADFAHSGIQPLDDDELEEDELPQPKDGKRYTRAELEKLSQDQLYIAAGSGPTK